MKGGVKDLTVLYWIHTHMHTNNGETEKQNRNKVVDKLGSKTLSFIIENRSEKNWGHIFFFP